MSIGTQYQVDPQSHRFVQEASAPERNTHPRCPLTSCLVLLMLLPWVTIACDRESAKDEREEANSAAQDSGNDIRPPAQNYVEVVTEDWKPFSYEEDGVVKGSSTKIVRAVLDRMGVDYSINVYPWARAYSMASKDRNTLIYAIVRTHQREPLFSWVGQVAQPDKVCFYKLRDRKDINIQSLVDAKKYVIGTNRDSDKHQFLVANDFADMVLESDQRLSVKQLLAGRIELLIMHEINLVPHFAALNIPVESVEKVHVAFTSRSYMAFSKNSSDDLVQRAIAAYEELVRKGQIEKY